MDLLALIIASFTLPAVLAAVTMGAVGYLAWGWIGAVIGVALGYAIGVWYA